EGGSSPQGLILSPPRRAAVIRGGQHRRRGLGGQKPGQGRQGRPPRGRGRPPGDRGGAPPGPDRGGGPAGGPPRPARRRGGRGGRRPGRGGGGGGRAAAARRPGARVGVDMSRAPLDRPFASLVPEPLSAAAVPGRRVRVRFAGRLTSGYLLQRTEASEHQGQLAFLERVVSPEPVLTAEVFGLARAVADRYGGTLAGVLPLGSPPRHAAPESATPADVAGGRPGLPEPGPWARYPAGRSFLTALARGRAPRAAWSA